MKAGFSRPRTAKKLDETSTKLIWNQNVTKKRAKTSPEQRLCFEKKNWHVSCVATLSKCQHLLKRLLTDKERAMIAQLSPISENAKGLKAKLETGYCETT